MIWIKIVENVFLGDVHQGETIRQCRNFKMKVNFNEKADAKEILKYTHVSSNAVVF